jgi:hypothetical protein
MDDAARMSMDEASARRVLLAQAIESADREGKLLTPHERDQVDRQARDEAVLLAPPHQAPDPRDFLGLRAGRLLAAVGVRHPGLLALQEAPSWQRWMGVGVPLAALVLGVLTDVIGNPHRVDLVSLPLLGIVAWNLAVYAALLLGLLMPRRAGRRSLLAGLGRWSDGERALHRRGANLRTQVAAHFHMRWFELTEELHLERLKRVLHLSAAAWAIGVILSLLVRGLVVEYRVGWESTFLGAQQVYAILSVLRLPALLLFPFADFTVQDVAAMRFSNGGGAVAGAHWVFMYVALLLAVVVIPRLVLAGAAGWRERRLARAIALDVRDPYFERIVSLLNATRVQLGLVAHRPHDRAALLRVIAPEPEALPVLIGSGMGDVLRLVELPLDQAVPHPDAASPPPAPGWTQRFFGPWRTPPSAGAAGGLAQLRDEIDVVLHVTSEDGDIAASRPLLAWLGKPVVTLVNGTAGDGALRDPAALPFDAFARCWVQEHTLLDAISRRLPAAKATGFARIAKAWDERNALRLQRAMGVIAEHLLYAARQVEEVQGGALSVKSLLPAERQAQSAARQSAVEAIVKRLDASAAETFARLRHLHGVDAATAQSLEQELVEKFRVQQPIDTPQAGMAGAATGAAMGASVDLLAGGLTLGAATALGALVGGSAAYLAAAWKNRASPGGATLVQLSDEMMRAMTQAALLRYFAVTHCAGGSQARWNEHLAAAVEARRDLLAPYWMQARTQPNPSRLAQPLARELEGIVRPVLDRGYPRTGGGTRAATAASAAP